ncbi:MAG TPA: phosphatase PAP2 family protein [Mycobacterium sp.]|nr:phosphatase PAP2 family protein [Mycobacterium sp.]
MSDRPPALPFWLRSLLCLAASACFFVLLVALTYNIREGGDAIWLDGAIARHVHPHVGPRRTKLALTLTQIGSPLFIVPATLAAALVSAIVRRSIWTGIVVTATVGLVGIASTVGKQVITAAHPQFAPQIQPGLEHTFPSGHVASALSLLGIVAIAYGAKPRHLIIWLGIAAITAIVAATRIYLGAHWFSDTLGGVFLGCSAVFFGAALLQDRNIRRPSPPAREVPG